MISNLDLLDNDTSIIVGDYVEKYREKYKWEKFSDKFIKACFTNYFIGSCILSNRLPDCLFLSVVSQYLKEKVTGVFII